MPQNNRRVSMRLRRLITLSVAGALVVGVAGIYGLPKVISDQVAKLPESVQNIANQVAPKPVTIFDPPKYSIDEADSIWVVVNKQRQISPLRYQPKTWSFQFFQSQKFRIHLDCNCGKKQPLQQKRWLRLCQKRVLGP
jgi:hypothetical protein